MDGGEISVGRGQKSLIIFVSYATAAMLGVYLAVFNSTILPIAESFHKNAAEMGLMISMYFFGISLAPLLIGLLSGRIGKKKLLIISYSLMVTGMILVGATKLCRLFRFNIHRRRGLLDHRGDDDRGAFG
jgi:MFS family permease